MINDLPFVYIQQSSGAYMNDIQKGDIVYHNKNHLYLVVGVGKNTIEVKGIWSITHNFLIQDSSPELWGLYSTIFRGNIDV